MKNVASTTVSLALILGFAACGGKQQPAVQTTTHTDSVANDPNGDHSKTDSDSQHTVKQDGTMVDKSTTTTTAVTPPGK